MPFILYKGGVGGSQLGAFSGSAIMIRGDLVMKNRYGLILMMLIIFMGLSGNVALAQSDNVSSKSMQVLGKNVNVVTIDFNNTNLTFDIVKGNDQRAGWEDFSSIINRTKPTAAINGNYFNAYADNEEEIIPWGYIIKDGDILNNGATINRGSFAVTFDRKIIINNGEEFPKHDIETMIEAGPLLLLNGVIVAEQNNAAFSEDKITQNPAQRSAIGVKPNGHVIMVTGAKLKITELANILYQLGCIAATNLDGGASSALYANGKYITNPGRKLNTVLLVYDHKENVNNNPSAIQVILNGSKLDFDVAPVILEGRTLVPLQVIFNAMGVNLNWNGKNQIVTAQSKGITINLPIGSKAPTVNNVIVPLDVPATIIDGRTFVPVRFISESLGALVRWDESTKTIYITSDY